MATKTAKKSPSSSQIFQSLIAKENLNIKENAKKEPKEEKVEAVKSEASVEIEMKKNESKAEVIEKSEVSETAKTEKTNEDSTENQINSLKELFPEKKPKKKVKKCLYLDATIMEESTKKCKELGISVSECIDRLLKAFNESM